MIHRQGRKIILEEMKQKNVGKEGYEFFCGHDHALKRASEMMGEIQAKQRKTLVS